MKRRYWIDMITLKSRGIRKKHKLILGRIAELRQQLISTGSCEHIDFEGIFEAWLIDHVFSEDRKYGKFLNSKGVF